MIDNRKGKNKMSYEHFSNQIQLRFGTAKLICEDGKYIAILPEGIRIFGNSVSKKITIKWGSGHMALIEF